MAEIDTIVDDIYKTLSEGVDKVPEELVEKYTQIFANFLRTRFLKRDRKPTLRMSNLGKPCERQLYYEINEPEGGEEMTPATLNKFLTGDLIEIKLLFLAELSGHKVEGTQDTQVINGVEGHRDAVIDGHIVDTKSASSNSFKKFKEHNLEIDDPFGYLKQGGAYLFAGQTDSTVKDKERFSFLVEDKQHGHVCLDTYTKQEVDFNKLVDEKRAMLNAPEPPPRAFEAVPDGKSGNMKLGVNCSYCVQKFKCWENLQQYNYSFGPVFLTEVHREPRVPRQDPE